MPEIQRIARRFLGVAAVWTDQVANINRVLTEKM
jgi:hypothetical protein